MNLDKIIEKLEGFLNELKNFAKISTDQPVIKPQVTQSDFEKLKDYLNSDYWPQAAPDFLICEENEQDKFDRAEGIVNYISQDLKDKKFLDFGCGEGHVASKISALETAKSYGYDIIKTGFLNWEESKDNFLLTTDFAKIKAEAPYDYVLLYDVLDHVDDPVKTLNMIGEITNESSKVFVRCHPFCARHGTHLYRKLNKAYLQLVFTDEELNSMNLTNDIKQRTYFPLNSNNSWFQEAKFKVLNHDSVKTLVEDFFKNNKLISDRIMRSEYNKTFPEYQMSQVFNDFILQKL